MRNYKITPAAPYCCVCAVIESIAQKYGYNISQYDLANYATLVCSPNDVHKIPKEITNYIISEEPTNWGIHLNNNTINSFFLLHQIPLKETFISASQFDDILFESILQNTSEIYDVMLYFSYGSLYNNPKNLKIGHCGLLIENINDKITYIDPGPINLGFNTKETYEMYLAIKRRSLLGAGLSIISPL